jgi:AcrR family transcriptional regulator
MHYMTESAIPNRRERRMRETAESLTRVSRRLTAEHGLAGFTIEELCDEVDVSRRTFFNYFASKEDAVVGANPDDEWRAFAADFLARPSAGWSRVVDDLVELAAVHFDTAHDPAAHADLVRAVEREPRLLARFVGMSRDREMQLAELVAAREGGGTRAEPVRATVAVVSALMRQAGERFMETDGPDDLATTLTASLAAMRAVLADTPARKAHS